MRALRTALAVTAAALLAGCLGPQDNQTNVHDLRVLGMQFDPPEVMLPGCNARLIGGLIAAGASDGGIALDPRIVAVLALGASVPLDFTTLIADPNGGSRQLSYELRACISTGDRTCGNDGENVLLAQGTTAAGELKTRLTLGTVLLPDATPLLLGVINKDLYKGFGGIRVPVVLHLKASDTNEEIYAQKLMVFQCQFFPQMKQNVLPVMPGVNLEGEDWPETDVRELAGEGPFLVEPQDFVDREEPYVVPSLTFTPVNLVERWKVNYFASVGTFDTSESGGADLGGNDETHKSRWQPGTRYKTATDVDFWFTARDGRGGESWLHRKAHWTPP